MFTPAPLGIMGVVNVTPDSFSDGGQYETSAHAITHALRLLHEGAAILDIGGESTRPESMPVLPEVEQARILPVLAGIYARAPEVFLSVDTRNAHTAELALRAGACIVNDISACLWDSALLDVLAAHTPGYVLTHCQDTPKHTNIVDEVVRFFETYMARLVRAGLPESHIVLDPGIGFGKRGEHVFTQSLTLLRGMERILALGRPVCVGLSRKSFLGDVCGEPDPHARDPATHAAVALAALSGVCLHRVHDVAGAAQALAVAQAWKG